MGRTDHEQIIIEANRLREVIILKTNEERAMLHERSKLYDRIDEVSTALEVDPSYREKWIKLRRELRELNEKIKSTSRGPTQDDHDRWYKKRNEAIALVCDLHGLQQTIENDEVLRW